MASNNDEKKPADIPGLDDLLGLSEGKTADLTAYRRLNSLKKGEELSDERLALGFEDLLKRRQSAPKKRSIPATRWVAAAAGVTIALFAGLWLMRARDTEATIVVQNNGAGIERSRGAVKTAENQLINARVEDLDLRMRGVNGLTAKTGSDTLSVTMQSGFLEANYHPGANRKKLAITVGGTRFRVIGTRFFVQATGGEVKLVVSEGKVGVERQGSSYEVSAGKMWSDKAEAVTPVTGEQLATYTQKFEDVKTPAKEIDPIASAVKEAPKTQDKPKKQARVILKLGQVISGILVGEDEEAVVLRTAQGRELRIARSEIEKVERGR